MTPIHWLASYPKSGNTWVRILLANYLTADEGPADINLLTRFGMTAIYVRAVVDQYLGFKSSCLPPAVLQRLRPDVARAFAAHAPPPLVLKVHDAWSLTDRGEPLFPPDVTAGVIYVLRNPLDVAPSAADHWGLDIAATVERMCDPEDPLSGEGRELANHVPQWIGGWSEHVTSWLDRSGLPVRLVRYEDLIADPVAVLTGLVEFLGWQVDPARIGLAVERSRFEQLQAVERGAGFRERSPNARTSFFRRGKAGSWRDELPADLVRRLIDAHGDTMVRFGYVDARGQAAE